MSFFEYEKSAAAQDEGPEHRILENLSESDWARLLIHVEQVKFRAGELVIRKGQIDRSLLILLSGDVVVMRNDGTELARLVEGTVIGEISFFDGAARSADVRALTDGLAIRISRDKFEYLNAWEPEIARTLLVDLGSVLATRLRETTSELNG